MVNRAPDWFRQAQADLQHARHSADVGDFDPTRYPNGFDSGAPTDYFTGAESRDAIRYAEAILEFCRHQIDRP